MRLELLLDTSAASMSLLCKKEESSGLLKIYLRRIRERNPLFGVLSLSKSSVVRMECKQRTGGRGMMKKDPAVESYRERECAIPTILDA